MNSYGDHLFRVRRRDSGGSQSGTVLPRLINSQLGGTVVATLAGPAGRD